MTKSFLIILLLAGCISCNAQSNENDINSGRELATKEKYDSSNTIQPKVDIQVDKQYDEDGNLIGYDSTYTYIYRSLDGDTVGLDMDSVFEQFQPFFQENFKFYSGDPFKDLFSKDSIFYHRFFNDSYYLNRFRQQSESFEEILREMDSLKNKYFQDNFYQEDNNKDS